MAENKTLPIGCVIMASGLSTRFGSNKLLTPFGPGREPMLRRAFAATDTPLLASRVVVARSPEVETLCREVGTTLCGWDWKRCWQSGLTLRAACSCPEISLCCGGRA